MEKTIFIDGPDPTVKLAYSDVWLPGLYSRRVFVFELPAASSHEKAIAVLERALKALVLGTPELGSESVLVPEAEHDRKAPWRALKPYKGIELVVKDYTKSFPTYKELEHRGFPLAAFKDRLLMPIPLTIEPEPQPQAKFQASLIGGGILLSTCIYHHLTDGNGMNTITRALGEACRLAASHPSLAPAPVVLNTDRGPMFSLPDNIASTDLSLHPAYKLIPDFWRPGISHEAAPSAEESLNAPPTDGSAPPPLPADFLPAYFRLTSAAAERLRADARAPMEGGGGGSAVSTHDAIMALLWRTLMLARHARGRVREGETVTYTFPRNAREYLGLPGDWVGNCVYFCAVEVGMSEILGAEAGDGGGEGSLPALAKRIRAAIDAVDTARVEGVMTLRRRDPYALAWWPVADPADPKVLAITSFYQSGLLGVDWGAAWGPVRHFTTTDVGAFAAGYERTSFVGPKIGGGRGCDVMVGADAEELEFFRTYELWNRYFEPLKSEPLKP